MRNNLTELQLGAIPPKYIWRCPATRGSRRPEPCLSTQQSHHRMAEFVKTVAFVFSCYFMRTCRAHGLRGYRRREFLTWLLPTSKLRLVRNLSMWRWAAVC